MSDTNSKGKLFVISGPSGVGKTTLCQRLLERVPARMSVSATTRPARRNEKHEVDYYFLSPQEFEQRLAAGEFLESAEVFGNRYGTPVGPVKAALDSGQDILLEIDVQGGIQVHERFPDAVGIFIMPPSLEAWRESLRRRLTSRGMDQPEEIERRVSQAEAEINLARDCGAYRHFVVNDDLEHAVNELVSTINKESHRDD